MKNEIRNGHLEGVNSVIVSFENRFMISRANNSIRVWDIRRGIELKTLFLKDETDGTGLDLIGRWVIAWLISNDQIIH